jgi:hypothetical protein
MKFDICVFFDNLASKPKFDTHLTSITGTLLETYVGIFTIISRCIFLRMRNITGKSFGNIKTHFVLKFFRKLCRWWDKVYKYGSARQATDDNITRRMRFSCMITKYTDTHSTYLMLIAIPWQQWLRECASILRYMSLRVLFSYRFRRDWYFAYFSQL